MQKTCEIDFEACHLIRYLWISPERKHGGRGGKEGDIGIASRLGRFTTMVNRVIIANGKGQLMNLVPLYLLCKRRKALADLAFVKHAKNSFIDPFCYQIIGAETRPHSWDRRNKGVVKRLSV